MTYRDYDPDKDSRAVRRIWKEVGWLREEETDGIYLDGILKDADDVLVATLDGEPECAAISVSGDILYLDAPLRLGVIAGVTTSRVARKLGFARDLTVKLLARQASAGLAVSALGMFEQGYYDKLGFGTGPYEQWIRFDPASLTLTNSCRPPKRLHVRDYEAVHAALCNRRRGHGGVVLRSVQLTRADLGLTQDPFGLGYHDDSGGLSHFIWGNAAGQHGPYTIKCIAWQTPEQLLELLALIKSLGDQVAQISMLEIGEIQLQDFLRQPIRARRATRDGEFVNDSRSLAYWQFRILDLAACIEATHLNTAPLRFNLQLDDPVTPYLDDGDNWRGISGEYVVELGEHSTAEPGKDAKLHTLRASVNAFSRMWFGIRPASSLAITDTLSAQPDLLSHLDATLRLPRVHTGLDF